MLARAWLAVLAPLLCAGAESRHLTALQRLEASHLEAVHQQRVQWMRDRVNIPINGVYHDYRAVIHVHAEDAPHTLGTREQVLAAAKAAGVDIVLWTDHHGPKPDTWKGIRDRVLFLPGAENEHELRFPWNSGDLRFWSHLEETPKPSPEGFAGTEIYNRHTDAVVHKKFLDYIANAMAGRRQRRHLMRLFQQFPDEMFAAGTDALPDFLAKWDAVTVNRQFTGIAANDAHQNQVFGDAVLDPYEVAFRNVSTHILARELSEDAVMESLRDGHAYVAHDWLCDPAGFLLVATNNLGIFDMGDRVPMFGTTRIEGRLPVPAKVRVIRNGTVVKELEGNKISFTPEQEGTYRFEAWLNVDGEDRPWIYTNPFYLYPFSTTDLKLPSNELSPGVKAFGDVTYAEGDEKAANKHKLDIYAPENASNAPVLFFVHGGSWQQGDRSQYTALGNRFAKAGYVVVIPSYRLMPANPHPAQIEDVAAAFAWTWRYIDKYGGNPKRIVVAGHSAGGHLVSLLALDPEWLTKHGLQRDAIRGVASLSGVYDVGALDRFGDEASRRAASPMTYVRGDVPPFLITYCQWDYFGLPAQARAFDAALRKAFVSSTLTYIPRQNHISEIVDIWKEGDATADAMLGFMASVLSDRTPAK